jgi:hypothetical protein
MRFLRMLLRESVERFVQGKQFVVFGGRRDAIWVEVGTPLPASAFGRLMAARLFDENAADRLGRGGEEVTAALELLIADESQIGFVNEGRRVERLARLLAGEPVRRELAELVVDERQQLRGSLLIAAIRRLEELRDGRHFTGSGRGLSSFVNSVMRAYFPLLFLWFFLECLKNDSRHFGWEFLPHEGQFLYLLCCIQLCLHCGLNERQVLRIQWPGRQAMRLFRK